MIKQKKEGIGWALIPLIIVIISIVIFIFLVILKVLSLKYLLIPVVEICVVFIIVALYIKLSPNSDEIKPRKGKMISQDEFREIIDKKFKDKNLKLYFNYKREYDIVPIYLGRESKKNEENIEVEETRIPVYEARIPHLYKNTYYYVLMNAMDTNNFLMVRDAKEEHIKEWKKNFTFAKEKKLLKKIYQYDPLQNKNIVKEEIKSDEEEKDEKTE